MTYKYFFHYSTVKLPGTLILNDYFANKRLQKYVRYVMINKSII